MKKSSSAPNAQSEFSKRRKDFLDIKLINIFKVTPLRMILNAHFCESIFSSLLPPDTVPVII